MSQPLYFKLVNWKHSGYSNTSNDLSSQHTPTGVRSRGVYVVGSEVTNYFGDGTLHTGYASVWSLIWCRWLYNCPISTWHCSWQFIVDWHSSPLAWFGIVLCSAWKQTAFQLTHVTTLHEKFTVPYIYTLVVNSLPTLVTRDYSFNDCCGQRVKLK